MPKPHAYVVVCEVKTGIVLKQTNGGWSRIVNGDGNTYICFDTVNEAKDFIRTIIGTDANLECSLFDAGKNQIARYHSLP